MTVTVTNCRNGELVIRAPQGDLDKIVNGLEGTSVTIEKQPAKPTPLGLGPIYNWGSQAGFANAVARSSNSQKDSGKPTPIPQSASRIDFAALSKAQTQTERGLVNN